ncbi:phosphoribosyl transferase [Fischerella thermalis CCMEE 5282]|uniref:phosphoribosyltransferase n=1 Tax=Fischerella thermalis TaxID=372787 RepID=UPI000C809441|nr:phosphoribosyltransferase [Fischerella thermalis]PMB16695.1 phosphoribosyl transferase [Fischerella thermalis CCMEE 5282]
MVFKDRTAAGQLLAAQLAAYANRKDVIVLALPRGGVPVAFEVARKINAPLDVFLVRKLGVPGHEELAMGAIASGGVQVLNEAVVQMLGLSQKVIEQVATQEQQELNRRERLYRDDRPFPVLHERTVILVDDGLATGTTMRAAVVALRQQQPARLLVAVPVSSPEAYQEMQKLVDEIVCPQTPDPFYSVGLWYQDFPQVSDEEVCNLLKRATNNNQHSTVSN